MRISSVFRLLIVISCTEDDSALVPAFIEAVSPINDNIYLSEGPYLVTVRVTNKDRNPLPGIEVMFEMTQGDAVLTATQAITDANGVAYTYINVNSNNAPIVLETIAAGLSDKVVFTYGVSKSHTSQLLITDGNNQDVGAGLAANKPLKIKVMDDLGILAVGISVKFVVMTGNGQVASEATTTDASGQASTTFIASTSTIENTVAAVVGSDSVFFHLESLYISALSFNSTRQSIEVKWSQNKATRFQKYSLHRAGSDGIYQPIAEFTHASDTAYTDSSPDLIVNSFYMYKIVVHALTASVENAAGTLFGELVQLKGIAIDFEVDESRNQLYVSLPELNQIHIYDLNTYELKEEITVGSKPHGISLSHDKSTLYIALYGSGRVAFLNLTSKQVTQLDVSEKLGDLKAFDVMEGAPGRVFVTGSPEQYGIAFVVVIKTDENNLVERFMPQVVRFHPALAADYGKYFYVLDGNRLYKLDPYGTYTDPAQEADYVFSSSQQYLVINPAGTKLYLDLVSLNTNPVSAAGVIGANVPAISPDGSVVHYHAGTAIRSYNTTTLQKIKETGFFVNYLRKLELTSDNTTFIALGVNYSSEGDVLYFIHNE
jgi:DNA-binding beta-propeller fold protein YncE